MARRWEVSLIVLAAAMFAAPPVFAHPPAGTGRMLITRDSDPTATFNADIYSMNADGSNRVNLTPGRPGLQQSPAISPDGRLIVFREDVNPAPAVVDGDIFVMGVDGSNLVNITAGNSLNDGTPTFSPDGRSIAFARDLDPAALTSNFDIFVMGVDGSNQVDLSAGAPSSFDVSPDFSPDGRRIVFARDFVPGNPIESGIVSMNIDGSNATALTSGTPDDDGPAFSPNGRRIAFSRAPQDQLHLINPDGSGLVNLTPTFLDEALDPSWSPDGSRLAFDDDNQDVYVLNADGSGLTNLTSDGEGNSDPSWEYVYRCAGRRATIVGDDGPDKIKGTKKADVIVANAGKDKIRGRGGNDRICGGKGKDLLVGGKGTDRLKGGKGKDVERQ